MILSKSNLAFNFIFLMFISSTYCMQNKAEKSQSQKTIRRSQGCSLKKVLLGCLFFAGSLTTVFAKSAQELFNTGSFRQTCRGCSIYGHGRVIECSRCTRNALYWLRDNDILYSQIDAQTCADDNGSDIVNQGGYLRCVKQQPCVPCCNR